MFCVYGGRLAELSALRCMADIQLAELLASRGCLQSAPVDNLVLCLTCKDALHVVVYSPKSC